MKNYSFDTVISKEVLENYLSRAVSAAWLIDSLTLDDDLRALKRLGVKFIGRASGIWEPEADDELHFNKSRSLAKQVHEMDPDVILQACIFEAVYRPVERFPIPAYVFQAFNLPAEERCFRFEAMRFPKPLKGLYWGNDGALPDITQTETQFWFYYRATRYILCGYEAFHMGQIHLYCADDKGYKIMSRLMGMIRDFASLHARRHLVLMDAHSHGININGRLLLDYHAMPFTRVALTDRPGDCLVLKREGFSEGGQNPSGWEADVMPYLMEYDNWGGKVVDDFQKLSNTERAQMDWWGYDQIGWFANQDEKGQRHFLEYTYKWTAVNNVNAYFAIPFRRTLGSAAVMMTRADNGKTEKQEYYQINRKRTGCPMGFSQEDTVKALWDSEEFEYLRKVAGNPVHLMDYGAHNVFDPETGVKLPEFVSVYGSFQPQVGAVANDSSSTETRMYYIGDNTYTLSVVIPYACTYDFAISTYGTLSATLSIDHYPRSGSSNKAYFTTWKDNTVVRFSYRFITNEVTVDMY